VTRGDRTIVRAAALVAVPWANRGGVTRIIADRPRAFRLSLATIADAGAFSRFPGVIRHFALVSGRVDLTGQGATLDAQSSPVTFPGDRPVAAALPDGPALALNLMVPMDAPPLALVRSLGDIRHEALAIFACGPVVVDGVVALDIHDTLLCKGSVRVAGPALVVVR
jgi:environmental stress-induced protein Ves